MNGHDLIKGQAFVGYVARQDLLAVKTHYEEGQVRRLIDGEKVVIVLILPFPADEVTAEFYRSFHESLPHGHPHQFADGRGLHRWVSGVKDRRSHKVHLYHAPNA